MAKLIEQGTFAKFGDLKGKEKLLSFKRLRQEVSYADTGNFKPRAKIAWALLTKKQKRLF